MPSLTVTEAETRASSIRVLSYEVELDLTRGDTVFFSRTRVEFESRDGRDSFVDVKPERLLSATLNGRDVASPLEDGRIGLTGIEPTNVLLVEALMRYSNDGQGMHRSVDPEDGRAYVYAMSFMAAAPRIFACFDQPDLKAVVRLTATTPSDWTVLGNTRATQTSTGAWAFGETKPLSTYFVTFAGGPYHSLTTQHDGIELGLHCRQSLAPFLDKDREELFEVTGQCFDEFHRLFAIRYPFGDYHQVFVPDFNAGAMENPGCVTFSDDFVFRAPPSESLRATRAVVVAHEMAHQWFGDLVTMRWWDDLWLNESFAEYMGYRVASEVTRFSDVWTEFALGRKAWGMSADQRRSTHPVAGNGAQTARQAMSDFDGISYSKGASALRQLRTYLGDSAFIDGVTDYLRLHSYGNATLADLIDAWQRSSGKDVRSWADVWLRVPGVDTLELESSGATLALVRTSGSPGQVERPHSLGVSWFTDNRSATVHVDVTDRRTPIEIDGYDGTGVVLADSGDDTWAKIIVAMESASEIVRMFDLVSEPLPRAVIWGALREGLLDARLSPQTYCEVVETVLPAENDLTVESVLRSASSYVGTYLDVTGQRGRIAETARAILADAPPATNRQLIAVRGAITLTDDSEMLQAWLHGAAPEGLTVDDDLRWRIIRALCSAGAYGRAEIDAEGQRDRSSQGHDNALRCRASLPTESAKREVWRAIATDATLTNREVVNLSMWFFQPGRDALLEPYVARFFEDIPATEAFRESLVVEQTAKLGFPRYAVARSTVELAEARMARGDLSPGTRRAISDGIDDMNRAIASRTRWTAGSDVTA